MKIENAKKAVEIAKKLVLDWDKEHVIALILDNAYNLKKAEIISIGTVNASLIHPREVYRPAVKYNAVGLMLLHNHPTNNIKPSQEDLLITKKLIRVGKILGIVLLDHIVFCQKSKFYSMKQHQDSNLLKFQTTAD